MMLLKFRARHTDSSCDEGTRLLDFRLDGLEERWSETTGIKIIPCFVFVGIGLGDGGRNFAGASGVGAKPKTGDLWNTENGSCRMELKQMGKRRSTKNIEKEMPNFSST